MRYLAAVAGAVACFAPSAFAGARAVDEKRMLFSVVLVAGADGTSRYEIMEPGKVAAKRAELMKEFVEANKSWQKESLDFKKDPENRKRTFERPRPVQPSVTAVKENVRGREAAEKVLADMRAICAIVKIKGMDGKTTLEAVIETDLGPAKARLMAQYERALEEWQKESAAAAKVKGDDGPGPKPQAPAFTVVKKGVRNFSEARDMIQKMSGQAR